MILAFVLMDMKKRIKIHPKGRNVFKKKCKRKNEENWILILYCVWVSCCVMMLYTTSRPAASDATGTNSAFEWKLTPPANTFGVGTPSSERRAPSVPPRMATSRRGTCADTNAERHRWRTDGCERRESRMFAYWNVNSGSGMELSGYFTESADSSERKRRLKYLMGKRGRNK